MLDEPIPIREITSYPTLAEPELPKPGSFGLSRIGGLTGKLIAAGQAFSGDGSRWTHAFVVLDDETVIEAMPGGARIRPLAEYLAHEEIFFSDRPIQTWMARRDPRLIEMYGHNAGTHEQLIRDVVVLNARRLNGTGYGYLQYLALGLVAVGVEPRWLRRYIASKGRMICSQLVDEVYRRAGVHLFNDGRLPQDVTPGDLANYAGAS